VVGDWNENGGGTARTEGRAKSCGPDPFMQPEFLPGAGYWKTLRYGLWCNDWLAKQFFQDRFCMYDGIIFLPIVVSGPHGIYAKHGFVQISWINFIVHCQNGFYEFFRRPVFMD